MKRLRLRRHAPLETAKGPRLIDVARRQLVPDTPEEQVRQSVLASLVEEYGYPIGALLSEEPVARGTPDRRRADVLVRLPTHRVRTELSIAEAPNALVVEPTYTEKLQLLSERVGGTVPGLRYARLEDHLEINVDGELLRCKVLGFTVLDGGHGLALVPPQGVDTRLGLPEVFGFQVNGYGVTPAEQQLAEQLDIPALEWRFEENLWVLDELLPIETTEPHVRLGWENSLLTADGNVAVMIMYADDAHRNVAGFSAATGISTSRNERSVNLRMWRTGCTSSPLAATLGTGLTSHAPELLGSGG